MPSFKELSDIAFKIKNGLITHTKPFYYFYDYRPTRWLHRSQRNEVQHLVLEFKDWYTNSQEAIINILVSFVKKHFKNLENVVLFCIPASNIYSNNTRYWYFANEVCRRLWIENGISHIQFKWESEWKHLWNRNKKISDYIDIDWSFFQGKNILLFDDIVTKWETINEIRNLLLAYWWNPFFAISIWKTEFSYFSEDVPLLNDSFDEYTPIKIKNKKETTPVRENIKQENITKEQEWKLKPEDEFSAPYVVQHIVKEVKKEKTAEEKEKERRELHKNELIEIDGKVYRKNTIKKIEENYYYISQEYNLETKRYDEYYILLDDEHIDYSHYWDRIWCIPKNEHDFYKAKISWKIYFKYELSNTCRYNWRAYRPKNDPSTKKAIKKNKTQDLKGKTAWTLIIIFPALFVIWTILEAIFDNGIGMICLIIWFAIMIIWLIIWNIWKDE